jgi:hypothetical protein
MKVVNPNDTEHTLQLIPRFYPTDALVFNLYNEFTTISTDVDNIYVVTDGNLFITFDFEFENNSRYQIKITEAGEVVYRGKLIATTQTPQDYKLTNNVYYS